MNADHEETVAKLESELKKSTDLNSEYESKLNHKEKSLKEYSAQIKNVLKTLTTLGHIVD